MGNITGSERQYRSAGGLALRRNKGGFKDGCYSFYLKSAKNGIDIDFYVPEEGLAVQVAYSIEGQARVREVESLVRLARVQPDMRRYLIVTKQEQETIEADGITIEVVPAWRFLLKDPAVMGG